MSYAGALSGSWTYSRGGCHGSLGMKRFPVISKEKGPVSMPCSLASSETMTRPVLRWPVELRTEHACEVGRVVEGLVLLHHAVLVRVAVHQRRDLCHMEAAVESVRRPISCSWSSYPALITPWPYLSSTTRCYATYFSTLSLTVSVLVVEAYLRQLGPEVEDVLERVLPVLLLVHALLVRRGELARALRDARQPGTY